MNTFLLIADQTTGGDVVGGFMSMMAFFWILAIAATVFWIWAIVHALTHERTSEDKILWFLVIFFLHIIGAIIYFVVRRPSRAPA